MRYAFLLFMIIFALPVQAFEPRFFNSLHDIPIMEGLVEIEEAAISFDKANGRIAQARAMSEDLTQSTIIQFYDKTLPQMGWIQQSTGLYQREMEQLRLSFESEQGFLLMLLMLAPK